MKDVTIGAVKFPTDTLMLYEIPRKDHVCDSDIEEIKTTLAGELGVQLPEEFDFIWEVGNGSKDNLGLTGSLPKRIAKWYIKNHNIKVPETTLSRVGSISKRNLVPEKTILFDLASNLNWSSGDYGDDGSCMFSSYSSGRQAMEDEGATAIRIYFPTSQKLSRCNHIKVSDEAKSYLGKFNHTNNFVGVGRCWLMPQDYKDTTIWIAFNHYGSVTTFTMARMIATISGMVSKRISLHQSSGRSIFINGTRFPTINKSGTDSYVICPIDVMSELEKFGLTI